jgi:hypothetical protein
VSRRSYWLRPAAWLRVHPALRYNCVLEVLKSSPFDLADTEAPSGHGVLPARTLAPWCST